ncbi:MAG: nuclear transport factor 2 family protein, partial [Pseudoxanthomonas sp.]
QTLGKSGIGVTTSPVEIDMQGEHATVRFTAVLTGGNGRFLPDSAQVYAISSGWRIEDGKWRVYYAQWRTDP